MDFSQWKKNLKKGEKNRIKIDAAGFKRLIKNKIDIPGGLIRIYCRNEYLC